MTAEALNTITRPMKTRSRVTVKSHRSTLTRLAMRVHFTTETRRHGGFSIADFRGMIGEFGSGTKEAGMAWWDGITAPQSLVSSGECAVTLWLVLGKACSEQGFSFWFAGRDPSPRP